MEKLTKAQAEQWKAWKAKSLDLIVQDLKAMSAQDLLPWALKGAGRALDERFAQAPSKLEAMDNEPIGIAGLKAGSGRSKEDLLREINELAFNLAFQAGQDSDLGSKIKELAFTASNGSKKEDLLEILSKLRQIETELS